MFQKGISDEFVQALKNWGHWKDVIDDSDLFVAIRYEYVNIYFQGCSIFKISHRNGQLIPETHYKFLVSPNVMNPYVPWKDERPQVEDRLGEILINKFDLRSLKRSARWYAEAEKTALHQILKANKNVVDVEVALSHEAGDEAACECAEGKSRRVADRIDFAAIQKMDGKPCIVFFEAKRFDNRDLKSKEGDPRVFDQVRKYEKFIKDNASAIETSYRRVCQNLVDLAPNRAHDLVKRVAGDPGQLLVDTNLRLVVFGFDDDQRVGKVWSKHRRKLEDLLGKRLLLKGSPNEFTAGISKYSLKAAA
jgi:hypothetical protein